METFHRFEAIATANDTADVQCSDRGFGPAEFEFSPSLQTANVTSTITTRDDRSVTVGMAWEGNGAIESTSNTTTRPGFTGHFTGKEREAAAIGTVVADGVTLVDGATTNAEIETLEDMNISHPQPKPWHCSHRSGRVRVVNALR